MHAGVRNALASCSDRLSLSVIASARGRRGTTPLDSLPRRSELSCLRATRDLGNVRHACVELEGHPESEGLPDGGNGSRPRLKNAALGKRVSAPRYVRGPLCVRVIPCDVLASSRYSSARTISLSAHSITTGIAYLPGAYHDGAYASGLSTFGDDYYGYGSRPGDRYFDDPHNDYGEDGVGYPDLYDYTDFVQEPIGLYDAWGDDSWDAEQYALADLMYYQQQLELDTALSEAQRLRRWEDRLAWEQLDEEERALRYHELAASGALGALGLAGGFWGRRFGQMDHDLSYLKSVPLQRGVFGGPYRHAFARRGLAQRYSPYLSRQRLRAYQQPIQPWSVAYHSQRLSRPLGAGLGLREQELMNRLRIAELRASLTGLDPASRAQALEDARRLRAEIESEARLAREIDRSERRSDALYAAAEAEAERREWRHEAAEQHGIDRLEAAADALLTKPLYGSRY